MVRPETMHSSTSVSQAWLDPIQLQGYAVDPLRGEGCRERESVVRPLVGLPQPSLEIALSLMAHPDEFRENAMLAGFARVSPGIRTPASSSMRSKPPAASGSTPRRRSAPSATGPSSRPRRPPKMLHAQSFSPLDTGRADAQLIVRRVPTRGSAGPEGARSLGASRTHVAQWRMWL